MPFTVVVGLQWGDEGKGKLVDFLSSDYKWVVRFQGGANAGHTVFINGQKHVLHLLPTGLLRPDKRGAIGPGVAVDPQALVKEIDYVEKVSGSLSGRLLVDPRAHLVMPYHKVLDVRQEENTDKPIGTTRRGIGPSYRDRHARFGVRVGMLLDHGLLAEALKRSIAFNKPLLAGNIDFQGSFDYLRTLADRIAEFIDDVPAALWEDRNEKILLEGAQGTLLDVDYGTYPFVTSSNCVAGAACVGAGVPPTLIDRVIGIAKAYTTRVGEGPFPTEIHGPVGQRLQEAGGEFGASTGRPRRCGWLDLVSLRYAVRLNGATEIALTKLDVLNAMDRIKVAVAYKLPDGSQTQEFPAHGLENVKPVFEELPGWSTPDSPRAKDFIRLIEEFTAARVSFVSVGANREQTLVLGG